MKIKVDIFSGFLGAGKTKLIKKLIDEGLNNEKIVIIENEFGEVGIDASFLEAFDIKVKEINAGCICCSLLSDFKDALQEIISSKEYERIIIEPSGVGKLSEVANVIKELEATNEVVLDRVITVVDVTMFEDYVDFFSDFYKDQISNANIIVLSRTQNVSNEQTERVIAKIKEINSKENIITTPWDELAAEDIYNAEEINKRLKSSKTKKLHSKSHHAKEVFGSVGVETNQIISLEKLESIFKKFKDQQIYGKVIRAKGVVKVEEDKFVEFDYTPKDFQIRDTLSKAKDGICVIGMDLNKENIKDLLIG